MEYTEISVVLPYENEELKEIIVSELAEIGFESFMDSADGLLAYVLSKKYDKKGTCVVLERRGVKFSEKVIPAQNWNAFWESNFEPVVVDGKCLIKAGFHKDLPTYPYEILIDPKMSFGTGHHETTSLMISSMMDMNFSGKRVLDMGCGTGVLAIMASMLGASTVLAADIDPWSYENAVENAGRNAVTNVTFRMGDASELKGMSFDIILANINRNVLLEDIREYNKCLADKGIVLLSGFYRQDVDIIRASTAESGWDFSSFKEKNNWVAALFLKK